MKPLIPALMLGLSLLSQPVKAMSPSYGQYVSLWKSYCSTGQNKYAISLLKNPEALYQHKLENQWMNYAEEDNPASKESSSFLTCARLHFQPNDYNTFLKDVIHTHSTDPSYHPYISESRVVANAIHMLDEDDEFFKDIVRNSMLHFFSSLRNVKTNDDNKAVEMYHRIMANPPETRYIIAEALKKIKDKEWVDNYIQYNKANGSPVEFELAGWKFDLSNPEVKAVDDFVVQAKNPVPEACDEFSDDDLMMDASDMF